MRAVGRLAPGRLAGAALALLTGGCAQGILDPAGPVGSAERTILFNSLGIMLAVVVPTIVAVLGAAWWFRKSNTRAKYRPEFIFSGQIELVVWAIPAMVVLLLGGIAWIGSHDLDPPKPLVSKVPPLDIEVVALDWKWLFIYPRQGVATVNQMIVPAGTPLRFRITSATVMNNFFVPRLGSQIYAMAGMTTRLNLMADRPGRYPGLAAHYSGAGFSDMHFDVVALPPAQFVAWAGAMRGRGPALDRAGYATLAQRVKAPRPTAYGSVMPGLFDSIVRMEAPHPELPHLIGKARTEG